MNKPMWPALAKTTSLAGMPLCIHPHYVQPLVDLYQLEIDVAEMPIVNPVEMMDDGIAIMHINAMIDYKPSWLSDVGLMVSTQSLRRQFKRLANDKDVSKIVLAIDSPGGVYSGVPELANDIYAARDLKPSIAVYDPMAASGALWIGAAAGKSFMIGSGQAGSVGALMLHRDMSQLYASVGIANTIIRSPEGKADFNPLEPLSQSSKDFHQAQIDEIADEFIDTLAKFRGVRKSHAAEQFGQGRMLSATKATEGRLVDGIVSGVDAVLGSRVKRTAKRVELHPALQAALDRSKLPAAERLRQRAKEAGYA